MLERYGNTTTSVEETIAYAGLVIRQTTRQELEPNRRIRSEVIDGDTEGTVVEITLGPDSSSETKVTMNADLKLGKLGSMLGCLPRTR